MAKRGERFVDADEIRLGLFDNAAERLEHRAIRVDDSPNLRLDGNPAEVAPPSDAHALHVRIERSGEARWVIGEREWARRVGARDNAEKERNVGDASRHRTAR